MPSEAGKFQLRQTGEGKGSEKWLGIQRDLSLCVISETIALMKGRHL